MYLEGWSKEVQGGGEGGGPDYCNRMPADGKHKGGWGRIRVLEQGTWGSSSQLVLPQQAQTSTALPYFKTWSKLLFIQGYPENLTP